MRRLFVDNIELWLSAVGIVVIVAAPALLHASGVDAWRLAAIVATAVGVIHGAIFWLVRRRQRQIRREAVEELRNMLRERVNNSLTVISIGLSEVHGPETASSLADLQDAVRRISSMIATLSDDSLQSWKQRYGPNVERSGE